MLRPAAAQARLEAWFRGHNWNEDDAGWRGTIELITDLYLNAWLHDYTIRTTEIRDWACSRGWPDRDTGARADVAGIVHSALQQAKVISN